VNEILREEERGADRGGDGRLISGIQGTGNRGLGQEEIEAVVVRSVSVLILEEKDVESHAGGGGAHVLDGDADRATFVDEKGQVLWGDQSFALIASQVLARKPGSTLVTPVSSGRLIEDIVKQAGARIVWTEVGSVVVSHKIKEIGAELGGEENGGVFYPPHQPVRDGAMTAAQIVEIVATEGKALSELIGELPTYASTKTKVSVPVEKKHRILDVLLDMTEGQDRVTLDGIKLIYDEGWILLRPSGTEPLWRCFAEGKSQRVADKLAQKGVKLIQEAIAQS